MSDEPMYLSRATLRRDVSAAALRTLLVPLGEAARAGAGHRLVWTLFADAPDRERDFLWREAEAGVYYLLSGRPPVDSHGLFDMEPPKPFAPSLRVGDRLRFSLRANATVSRRAPGTRGRGKPSDVVMDALYRVSKGERAEARHAAIGEAGGRWLAAQGLRGGFDVSEPADRDIADESIEEERAPRMARVTSYRTLRVDHAGPAARIGVLDFEGELIVRDPKTFATSLRCGFGRAKAFGCGLMLVRRA